VPVKIEKGDIVIFNRNFNHFRKFDDVVVVATNEHHVVVQDDEKGKTYNVPYQVLQSVFDPIEKDNY